MELASIEALYSESQALRQALAEFREAAQKQERALVAEIQSAKEEIEILKREREEEYKQLGKERAALQSKVSMLESSYFQAAVPPFYFTLYNFTHHKKCSLKWQSRPLYTHSCGYKLEIEVIAGGSNIGQGSHVSVYVYILKGEFDNYLAWPFRGSITLQLLNERREGGHFEKCIQFTEETPLVNSGRVEGRERSAGWGDPLFISHAKLQYDSAIDTEYMNQDRLCFVVMAIELL